MLIVTAAIIQSGEKVLIARRNPMLSNGGRWEFPGGKVKPGEDPRSCLKREIREELGIEITVLDKLGTITNAEDQRTLKLLFYRSNWMAGGLHLRDHSDIQWVRADRLSEYDLTPPDRQFAEAFVIPAGQNPR